MAEAGTSLYFSCLIGRAVGLATAHDARGRKRECARPDDGAAVVGVARQLGAAGCQAVARNSRAFPGVRPKVELQQQEKKSRLHLTRS